MDFMQKAFSEHVAKVDLVVEVIDACKLSQLDELALQDLSFTINIDEAVVFTLEEVQDEASRQFGNQDGLTFCGARNYEVVGLQEQHIAYMQFEDRTITVYSSE